MKKRDLKIGVKGWDESMQEAIEIGRKIDAGFVPEQPVERMYFADFKTLLQYITPRRLDLLTTLHGHGATSIAFRKVFHQRRRGTWNRTTWRCS